MTVRHANAEWQGTLKEGAGQLSLGSGVFKGAYSFPSRFENGPGTNPEELIAAAHAGCFSMALTFILGNAGHAADFIRTTASVHLGATAAGPTITRIELDTEASVPGLDAAGLLAHAETARPRA
jgi:osmotically inducible protein OsmC